MAKFTIAFVSGVRDEEVEADLYTDHPPFVDFERKIGDSWKTVARFRQEEIRRVIRKD